MLNEYAKVNFYARLDTHSFAVEKCTIPSRLMSKSLEQVKESQCMLGEYAYMVLIIQTNNASNLTHRFRHNYDSKQTMPKTLSW